ncbi:MAG: hypothetical protein ACPG7F_08120 [Aggregatilineales bacterium]
MTWFLAALLASVFFSGQALIFQQLQKHYPISVFMTLVRLGSGTLLAFFFLRPDDIPLLTQFAPHLILSAFCSWAGTYAYNRAIRAQDNIGYVHAVLGAQTALSYGYSLLFLNASFEWLRLGGVITLTAGALLVSGVLQQSQHVPDEKNAQSSVSGVPVWFLWALLAAILFTIMTIFVRYTTDNGVASQDALAIILLITGVLFLGGCFQTGQSLSIAAAHRPLLIGAILLAAIGNLLEFFSYENTPNLAYTIAISNTRMILLYIIGLWMFSQKVQLLRAAGIALAFIGVMALSL